MWVSFILEWIERKILARIQSRIGPLYAGPRGILQPFADFIKLMLKEEINPLGSDRLLLTVIPILLVSLTAFALAFIPIFSPEPILSYTADLIYILGISASIGVFIIITGYANPGPYSNVGAARYGELIVSFEIPYVLSIASAAILASSTTIRDIVIFQAERFPIVLLAPLGFAIMLVSTMAKTERVPFDIGEAETEIAGGWQVELSGRRLAFYRLSMNLEVLLAASLCVSLYLGGGYGPFSNALGGLGYFIWFFVKLFVVILILGIIEGVIARYRIDQVLRGFWRYITPLAFLQVIFTIIIKMLLG